MVPTENDNETPAPLARHIAPKSWLPIGLSLAALLMVAAVVFGRMTGPSDLHDQTQPKTVAYTTNIILHPDRWALPYESETWPATKPPLYNWLAVPLVRLTQGRSQFAHKAPSVAAFIVLCVTVWLVGRRLDSWSRPAPPRQQSPEYERSRIQPARGGRRGFPLSKLTSPTASFAVMALASNYAWFKLSYLARPDSLLTTWIILGWVAVNMSIERAANLAGVAGQKRSTVPWSQLSIWVCTALAFLTKGPVAIIIPLYAVVLCCFAAPGELRNLTDSSDPNGPTRSRRSILTWLGRIGRRSAWALRAIGISWGAPVAVAISGAWVWFAWSANSEHFWQSMVWDEVVGRVSGAGSEGTRHGTWDLVRTAGDMPFYFLTRFLPWSLLFVGALIDLFCRPRSDRARGIPVESSEKARLDLWIRGCVALPILVIILFSLSAGKRADYIASAYPPAAILVGWSLTHLGFRIGRRRAWLVVVAGSLTIAGLVAHSHTLEFSARFSLGDSLTQFARRARPLVEAEPYPLDFVGCGRAPIQVLMHRSQTGIDKQSDSSVGLLLQGEGPRWIIMPPSLADELIETLRRLREDDGGVLKLTKVCESEPAQGAPGLPTYQIALYRLGP